MQQFQYPNSKHHLELFIYYGIQHILEDIMLDSQTFQVQR